MTARRSKFATAGGSRYLLPIVRRLAILAGLIAGLVVLWWGTGRSQLPDPGRSATTIRSLGAEVLHLDASDIVRRGPPQVLVVRIAGPVELAPHHYATEGFEGPRPAGEWAAALGVPLVFNAGQFDENLTHLGWLRRDGAWIVPQRHQAFQGILLSGPIDGAAWARVVDLDQADPAVVQRYRHAIQSMMLIDDQRRTRVRDSGKAACRTVVAEDTRGRILLVFTEGAVTLAELARWLLDQDLDIVRAMNLDGGIESQLVIDTPELQLSFYGQYGTGPTALEGAPGTLQYPLPAVIAVRPSAAGEAVLGERTELQAFPPRDAQP